MSNPKYAVWLWEKFGKHFQPAYDKIKALKLPPSVDLLFDCLWDVLSPAIKKKLWSLLEGFIKEHGEDVAKKMFSGVIKSLSKVLNI